MTGLDVTENLPSFRFTGASARLEKKSLGSFCVIGDIDHRMPDSTNSGIPYLMTGDFIGINDLDFENAKLISVDDYEQLSTKIKPEKGDILFARYASVGAVRYVETDAKFTISYSCAIIKSDVKKSSSRYVFYALQSNSVQHQIELSINTGSQRNIGIDSLSKIELYLPEKKEQIKIGQLFRKLDTLINQHQQKHDKLITAKKALIEKMFRQQSESQPVIRFKEARGKWGVCKLGENAIIKGRLGWKSLKQNEYLGEGPSMIAGRHISNGVVDWDQVDHIPEWRYFESPEIMLENNDIIFSKDGSLGNPAIVKNLNGYATINSTMMLVRPGNNLCSDFFYQVFSTKKFYDLIRLKVSGSSIPHLFQADMHKFTFDYPEDKKEQTKIGKLFQQLDTLINQHQSQLTKLNNVKQSLLSKMFV